MLAALGLLLAAPLFAQAQISASVSAMSDYRYRGISLSGGQAAYSVAANFDTAWGGYAGASLATARMRYTRVDAQAMVYAGYARRLGESASWDAGVSDTRYHGSSRYNYRELYLGVSGPRLNARIYTAAHYFGVGRRSVYAEVNGSHPLSDSVDLVGHVGYLVKPEARADLRIGINAAFDAWNVQLAWVATREQTPLYPALYTRRPRQGVLSVTRGF